MSFQGDVAGIGLANLLQSLARGRVGVLVLKSRTGLSSTIGLHTGELTLLPDAGEDAEIWRRRVRRAWARHGELAVDAFRMSEVARAVRLETLYRLLDSDGVNFRFAPGPLPERPESSSSSADESVVRSGQSADAVFCPPMPVEGLLLEYARLKDDLEREGGCHFLCDDVVPVPTVPVPEEGPGSRFLKECDADSTLIEIADRLGQPIRQARLSTWVELRGGRLRLAEAHELVALAQDELGVGNWTRAGARLDAWILQSWPGPPPPLEADVLLDEWSAGRLASALKTMPRASARRLVRRLDHARPNPLESIDRWKHYCDGFRGDALGAIRLLVQQARDPSDPNTPALRDLLAVSRAMREQGRERAAGAFLRIAAERELPKLEQRLEVGMGLLAVGHVPDGAQLVVGAAAELCDAGRLEEATEALRAVLQAEPTHREARRLYSRARTGLVKKGLTKTHTLVAFGLVLAVAAGAVVQVRRNKERELRLDAIEASLDRPLEALAELERSFAEDDSARVERLRRTLGERAKTQDAALRAAWTDRFNAAQLECTLGDPEVGLELAFALPAPPVLASREETVWPEVSDLLASLAARLEGELAALGAEIVDQPEALGAEEGLAARVSALRAKLAGLLASARQSARLADQSEAFEARLAGLLDALAKRGERRAEERERRTRTENLALQDRLLAGARAHAQAGDLSRALSVYEQLAASDPSGKLGELLTREVGGVRAKHDAVLRARELATHGRHREALEELERGLGSPTAAALPWRVSSFPERARARFADGRVLQTPFTLSSRSGERVSFTLEAEGYEQIALAFEEPADRELVLSRRPEALWRTRGRVDAPPVAVGEDHLACDREGRVVRLSARGELLWERALPTLGGVARAPVFLPRNPGHVLVLTEDGEAWILDAANGAADGPYVVGSPPVEGPEQRPEGVQARFANGKVLRWDARLRPLEVAASDEPGSADARRRFGSDAGLSILRRRADGAGSLPSPWSEHEVRVEEKAFVVRRKERAEALFTVRREGEWSFVAWEAPHTRAPHGRLWVSDGAGLRSFQP